MKSKVDYEYKSFLEPDTVVPPGQRIRGYLYGPQVVPISSAEREALKFKPEEGVLGFADRSSVLRYQISFNQEEEQGRLPSRQDFMNFATPRNIRLQTPRHPSLLDRRGDLCSSGFSGGGLDLPR